MPEYGARGAGAAIAFGLPSYGYTASVDAIGNVPVVIGASGKPLPLTSSDDPDCTAENVPDQLALPGTTSFASAFHVFEAKLIHGGDAFGPWPFGTLHTYTEPTAGVVVL
jgi:hypothetical protein